MDVNKNRLKRGAVVIALIVLSALFIGLFVDAVFEEPKWENYCREYEKPMPAYPYPDKIGLNCTTTPADQEKMDKCYSDGGYPTYKWDNKGCQVYEECNMCNKEMEDDRKVVHRNAFYLGAVLSIVVLVIGVFWPLDFIGTGFMFGGIVGLFYSTVRYFSDMEKFVRVGVIFAEICIVLAVTYLKILRENGNSEGVLTKMKKKLMPSVKKKFKFKPRVR